MRVAIMSARDVFKETGKIFSGENLSKTFNRVATITWLKQHKPDNAKAYLDFVKDLTYYDSVTFHTEAFCRNFVQLLGIKPHTGMKFPRFGERTLSYEGRSFKVMNAPISIMANKILEKIREKLKENEGDEDKDIRVKKKWTKVKNALQPDVQDLLGQMYDKVEYIIYSGAERGIPERARQYYQYLKDNPDMWGRVQLFQIMIPTRENLDEGDNEYLEVVKEAMYWFDKAAEDFKVEGWKPVILRDKKIDNDDAILLARALRFMGGELRHLICMAGALRDGLNLTVGETVIAQDKIYPGLIVVPEKIGAAQELGAFTWTYNPEDEGAFAGVMKRAIALYERKDCIEILREMHRNMKNYLLKNDLMNWAINCIRTVSDSAADELEVQNHKQKFAKLYKKSKESGYYTRKLAGSLDSEGTQVESCNRPSLTPS
jgi:trehalose-6-phosphate synthase